VVLNARVSTVDSRVPKAEPFAVKAGRFVAVGRNDEIKGLVGKKTQTYDARQMMIVPGFIDTHNHRRGEGLLYNVLVGNPYDVEFVTIQSIVDKLRARAATTPPGTWFEGYFFDEVEGHSWAERAGPGQGVDGAPGRRPPSRRPHRVL